VVFQRGEHAAPLVHAFNRCSRPVFAPCSLCNLYNGKGKWIAAKAKELGCKPENIAGTLAVESGGSGFVNGKLKIRFEVHIFAKRSGISQVRFLFCFCLFWPFLFSLASPFHSHGQSRIGAKLRGYVNARNQQARRHVLLCVAGMMFLCRLFFSLSLSCLPSLFVLHRSKSMGDGGRCTATRAENTRCVVLTKCHCFAWL
jgi:hypothetical protein